MTAFVRTIDHGIKIWVGRRSKKLVTYPDMLDTTVAGGLKAGHTAFQCILEEAHEEASLPVPYTRAHARPVGAITQLVYTNPHSLPFSGSSSFHVSRHVR